jgi:aspartate aminotransferase
MLTIHSHLKDLHPSATLAINEQSKKLQAAGRSIFKFGFGQSPFPVPELVQEALKQNSHQKDYLPVQGLPALRDQVAAHTNTLLGTTKYAADNIFIGPGSKELIYLTQLAIDAPLLLPNPSWVSYAPQAVINRKPIHWIGTGVNSWVLTADQLDNYVTAHKLQRSILILNDPSNPTGQQIAVSELKALAEVCRRHELVVVSDEIYGLLSFDGNYNSIASYYPEGTIISSGLSKWCGAGGWRLGTFVIPSELDALTKTLCTLGSETFSAVSAPIQFAAIAAFTPCRELEDYRKFSIHILKSVANYCYAQLNESGIVLCRAQGGFYLFPSFEPWKVPFQEMGIQHSVDLCQLILENTGVALLPGSAFGRPNQELTTRLSFVDFDGGQALKHMQENGQITKKDFHRLFPNMVEGLERLIAWIKTIKS